mgnify:CR=1 FL=1
MRGFLLLWLAVSAHAQPLLIAHRGASAAAPENTLAAFKAAWKEGADGIEGDFRLSQDGKIVCIHDETTKRTCGSKLTVAETPWARLRQLDAGSWKAKSFSTERIPLLEDVLGILPPNKYFFIEIKCGPEIIQPLKKAVAGADPKWVMFISFDPTVVKACRTHLPRFQAHLVSKLDGIHKSGNEAKQLQWLDQIDATGLQFKHTAKVSKVFMATLKSTPRLTACWTVDDVGTARRVAALGVDFITTNRPGMIRQQAGWTK